MAQSTGAQSAPVRYGLKNVCIALSRANFERACCCLAPLLLWRAILAERTAASCSAIQAGRAARVQSFAGRSHRPPCGSLRAMSRSRLCLRANPLPEKSRRESETADLLRVIVAAFPDHDPSPNDHEGGQHGLGGRALPRRSMSPHVQGFVYHRRSGRPLGGATARPDKMVSLRYFSFTNKR